ncbi:unnamed protein product [Natator depressus]
MQLDGKHSSMFPEGDVPKCMPTDLCRQSGGCTHCRQMCNTAQRPRKLMVLAMTLAQGQQRVPVKVLQAEHLFTPVVCSKGESNCMFLGNIPFYDPSAWIPLPSAVPFPPSLAGLPMDLLQPQRKELH